MSIEPMYDCEYQDRVVCPFCGHENEDSWEYLKDDEECVDAHCPSCGKEFDVTVSQTINYTSYCKEHDYADDASEAFPDKEVCKRCGHMNFKRFND